MFVDSHTHLQFRQFDKDRDFVIANTLKEGVYCINVGTDKKMSENAVRLAEENKGFWATVGLHPTDLSEEFDGEFYEKLAGHPKVVAIGECGFDYYRDADDDAKKAQEKIFREQIRLAKKINKKLMLHCRPTQNTDKSYSDDAYEDMLRVLKEEGADFVGGNVHFFVGSADIAERFLELGFSVSFSGVITITDMYDKVVKSVPKNKILVETDAPFAAPVLHRGKRNEPIYVKEIARHLARIRGELIEDVEKYTTENTKHIFGLEF